MTQTELSYRRSAIEGASPIGLAIALFDVLVGDLRRAASALRANDIELRCKELNHATLVIARLESWVDVKNGDPASQNLTKFYAYLRAKIMDASVKKSATLLEEQIEMILHVRTAWQQCDLPSAEALEAASPMQREPMQEPLNISVERVAFSQSA